MAEKYKRALETQHRVDIPKLTQLILDSESIISVLQSFEHEAKSRGKLKFKRIDEAVKKYKEVAKQDMRNVIDLSDAVDAAYTTTSRANDQIKLKILNSLNEDLDYLLTLIEVDSDVNLTSSTLFILDRIVVHEDMYRRARRIPNKPADDARHLPTNPYPELDNKDDPSCEDVIEDQSTFDALRANLKEILQLTQNYDDLNDGSGSGNDGTHNSNSTPNATALAQVSQIVKTTIQCTQHVALRLDNLQVNLETLRKGLDAADPSFSETVVFDFEKELEPITALRKQFEGKHPQSGTLLKIRVWSQCGRCE